MNRAFGDRSLGTTFVKCLRTMGGHMTRAVHATGGGIVSGDHPPPNALYS